jgi:molecular chaperone Hsp33
MSETNAKADELLHTLIHSGNLRCVVALTTQMVREAQLRHDLDPVATIALGRVLSCTAVLASTVKDDSGSVRCEFDCDGPLRYIVGECTGEGACRGYVAVPQVAEVLDGKPLPQSVGEAVGNGLLTVTLIERAGATPYNGVTELTTGEIAMDIAAYLSQSVQVPSAVAAGVKLDTKGQVIGAGAILIQRMGDRDLPEAELQIIEKKLHEELHLSDRIAAGADAKAIFQFLTGVDPTSIFLTTRPVKFGCTCTRETMRNVLVRLGRDEVQEIQNEVGKIEVRCQYCSTRRQFTVEELFEDGSPPSGTSDLN